MDSFSFLSNAEPEAFENLYKQYRNDPTSVEDSWQKFFQGFELAQTQFGEDAPNKELPKEFKVLNLIQDYRTRGHLFTKTNPVRERRKYKPNLDIQHYGLDEKDMDTVFQAGNEIGIGPSTLRDIINHLSQVYCQSIGVEFMYMREQEEVKWMIDTLHVNSNTPKFSVDEKKYILKKLTQASTFESYLHKKFPGQKRFSLEGGETLIPAIDMVVEYGADLGIRRYILGMAHRGRLNVLANIFNKPYHNIFSEFYGKDYVEDGFDGDVKYHLGYEKNLVTESQHPVDLILCPNPSHLEAVDPVAEGLARSSIDLIYNGDNDKVVPILIHGDAAIAGQGVVYEVAQMSQLDGYKTGGTIHIIINNQVGFTTNYLDGRSSIYCTDVAKVTYSPVFHVNGDDVEAIVHVVKIAMAFRQKFKQDVYIDLLCYRKYGHNEGDEPKFTQPILYKAIAKHPNPKEIYMEKLISEGTITEDFAAGLENEFKEELESEFERAKEMEMNKIEPFIESAGKNAPELNGVGKDAPTAVSVDELKFVAEKITQIPEGKKVFRKLKKIFQDRENMITDDKLDWGMAELLAYGTLLKEGVPVRMSGQDVERGTFSHRHAVVKLEDSEEEFIPLNEISKDQAKLSIYNSLLSEYGVLGFEWGYSLAAPHGLTIWEAQFGDFFNGAQIIIDQFLSTSEDKWKVTSGLVLLLPHGYEGMGAEHSSARVERFLTLCAEDNMQIVNCTTPANFFHALRRQVKRDFRKPLIVLSPKSLLRHPKCVSSLKDLAEGGFKELIDDEVADPKKIKEVVFCTGKLYYELLEKREELKADDMAIVRIEQMYPVPYKQIDEVYAKYSNCERFVWAQEEPENMGALGFFLRKLRDYKIEWIARKTSASPASGSPKRDAKRQAQMLERVFKNHLETVKA
ncbi:2-oxoglutarate dehydrogenase E1 component [Luteibaculum oceani]|uniref:oxoglutarate dehydrogenase (succinyl-transferring) n=1 Tax=Luteibaculum oceani TaxID=1294296 RepID=A0A5C6UZQ4_9FLAO|nr:2-oxoglutarate dehydrogenase E1 component [Luteibaculum oceani]TXC78913.1 2-oxoglutarate dehydrogenase E1 component [Luteibaculum oceani]